MTAQRKEHIIYKGELMAMATEPLRPYLAERKDIDFVFKTSSCWRGYIGKWEIKNNKLYLIDLFAHIKDYEEVRMDYVFPDKREVFADWFSGELRITQGEMLEYVHMGYQSVFEKDLFLEIKDGILVSEKIIDNRK